MKIKSFKPPVIVLTVCCLIVMFMISFMNSPLGCGLSVKFMTSFGLPVAAISGCLNAILLIIVSLIVIVSNGKGWKHAVFLQLIQLGHMLNLKIIAEGVESESQFQKLKEYDCDIIQGCCFGKSKLWDDLDK